MKLKRLLIDHVGHRGAFLAFLSLLDILYGYSILVTPGPNRHLAYLFPLKTWAYIWLIVGIILATGVPIRHDRFHFAVAAVVKALWAAAWIDVWVFFPANYPRAWVNVVLWSAFSAIVVVVSFWPEVRRQSDGSNGRHNE